jgi:predicted peptidase
MYLHGGSRRGDDIEKLREPGFGLTALVEKDKSFPFIVLSPQCPEGEYWTDTEALIALLDEVENKY